MYTVRSPTPTATTFPYQLLPINNHFRFLVYPFSFFRHTICEQTYGLILPQLNTKTIISYTLFCIFLFIINISWSFSIAVHRDLHFFKAT